MVEVTKPMGSFHIIDGEKVSVKYRGQARTCARCHQTEKQQCSGKGVAKNCQQDRVLLSTHMDNHWKEIGFIPDSNTELEVEEEELEIQIGRDKINKLINHGPDLTNRYSSIIVSGFSADQNLDDIHDLLLNHGLTQSTKCEDLLQDMKSGKITIKDLSPTDCLVIMDRMHGKRFFGKKVYVTSVVSASPVKCVKSPAVQAPNSSPSPPPLPTPSFSHPQANKIKLKITPTLVPSCTNLKTVPVVIIESSEDDILPGLQASSDSGSDSDCEPSPISPGMQAKIGVFDFPVQNSKFFRKTSQAEKRKNSSSPEMTRAEKKSLKKERKKMKKIEHQRNDLLKTK